MHRTRERRAEAALAGVMALVISACCRIPDDPQDPGASAPGKRAQQLLDAIASRDDAAVWSMVRTDGWDSAESFGRHLDKFPVLRAEHDLEWTQVHYVAPGGPEPSRTLQYCLGMAPHRVKVSGTLTTPAGETIALTLTEDEGDDGWRWWELRLNGRRAVLPRTVVKTP